MHYSDFFSIFSMYTLLNIKFILNPYHFNFLEWFTEWSDIRRYSCFDSKSVKLWFFSWWYFSNCDCCVIANHLIWQVSIRPVVRAKQHKQLVKLRYTVIFQILHSVITFEENCRNWQIFYVFHKAHNSIHFF